MKLSAGSWSFLTRENPQSKAETLFQRNPPKASEPSSPLGEDEWGGSLGNGESGAGALNKWPPSDG